MTAEYRHIPVLLPEVLDALDPHPEDIVCDCTLGGAGHAKALGAKLSSRGMLIGLDQDEEALHAAQTQLRAAHLVSPYKLLQGNFSDLNSLLIKAQVPFVNCFLFDLGVSSHQFDVPERGFSYRFNAPLDMRMDSGKQSKNAAEIINTYNEANLARIFFDYGEERHARRIAHTIVAQRAQKPYETTFELVDTIKSVYPAKEKSKKHPARKVFQALRIEVNGELEALKAGLSSAIRWLAPDGRLAVISYHSLEDRIVKQTLQRYSATCICPPDIPVCVCNHVPILKQQRKKPLAAPVQEVEKNHRAHSALLRSATKVEF